jgi:hypothetical protein
MQEFTNEDICEARRLWACMNKGRGQCDVVSDGGTDIFGDDCVWRMTVLEVIRLEGWVVRIFAVVGC